MFYLFLSKELFKAPFTVFQEMEIFFLSENFVKAKVNGNLMVQCLVNMANESELPSQAVTVFALVIKEMCHLVFSQWKIKNFLLSNSRYFLLYDAFSWSNWEQCLLELIYDFPEEAHNRGLPSNLTIYTVSLHPRLETLRFWLSGWPGMGASQRGVEVHLPGGGAGERGNCHVISSRDALGPAQVPPSGM